MQIIYTEKELPILAKEIIAQTTSKIICLYGEMGAGKTTLVKHLLKELGGGDMGNSPTFGIVNEYYAIDGEVLAYHFDFYRLNHETEALDIGFEDYISSNAWIFIEWPEKISSFLPKEATELRIGILDETRRKITLLNK
ncbi:tRNA (adenosine(37)-N6)-threonylcarbamoyltransferase complex ATPase subunit type 1 TsaE [Costertonia aggregata]|uniref:tRNA threonylcarbamoyladenosine biosynthesis protein TsaE n=1 Tax=Costertonia aggregata TaxID=343403 RepID=A0A7H9AV04_9FLAO|nr:tRNA (adenosine(37)-N6)-threonylcarbamoyltransferase complex ATPase subunit type 1 TsaE [Costertonia aggregata]